jgi:hypothetical protein
MGEEGDPQEPFLSIWQLPLIFDVHAAYFGRPNLQFMTGEL